MARYRVTLEATTYSVALHNREQPDEKRLYIGDVQRVPDGWMAQPYMHLGRKRGPFPRKQDAVAALVRANVECEKKERADGK
jgi:hypothetical protein